MASRQDPQRLLNEAMQLVRAHNMFVVQVEDKGVSARVLYRRLPAGASKKSERLGKSTTAAGFRRLVRRCAGVNEQ